MLFADASASIAIIAGGADADALADVLESDSGRLCSAMAVWETVAGLRRSYSITVPTAREQAMRFLREGGFRLVGIGERELRLAIDAHERYGEGRHRAALNMGDCFAYACAKANNARLLYKGEDFSQTDLA